ncbi:hypothetical protein Leryth_009681 [Lithospermum erythrorhizon]|nr:hypothetical protein Leryth_009681 [Lithospermum erythrorhizon]
MAAQPVVAAPPASLYVGDLNQETNESHLYDAFSEFKSLASVRVCRDSSTGRSLGYGYVNFISPQDAILAIEAKNHSMLHGKRIRVNWSHRDPDVRRSGIGNIFVKNLGDSIDNSKLQEMFQKYGNIISCKVATFEDGKSKGYGFVQFETEDSAMAAIEKVNGSLVEDGGKEIYVGKFLRRSDRAFPSPDAKYTNLYIKNLDPEITEEQLHEKFGEFGKIVSLVISKDENETSKGFGFVNFENPDDARRALEVTNGSIYCAKVLYVSRAQKKAEREQILRRQFEEKKKERMMKYQASNVFVKNIIDSVTDDDLREHFKVCGTITSAKIMLDDKGVSKGFGFICFSTPEEATKAVNTFHGQMFHQKPLYVGIAQRKEERQVQLQLHYAQRLTGYAGPSGMIAGGYPPVYYSAPTMDPARPGVMYPHFGMRPQWRANGFTNPAAHPFQPSFIPMMPSSTRPRQNRGRLYRNMHSNEPNNQQDKYAPDMRGRETNKNSGASRVISAMIGQEGPEMLSSMLAASSPEQQKQILGERLFPLVSLHQPELAAKITGMILEMDNSELLLLLESPDALTAKVQEAMEVLNMTSTNISSQDALHSNYQTAEVSVN